MRVVWWLPPWAWPLLAVVALLLVAWIHRQYRCTVPAAPPGRRRLLVGLRSAATILLLLALAGPAVYRVGRQTRPPEVAILIDDSASMALPDGGRSATRWQAARRLAAAIDSLARARGGETVVTVLRGNGLQPARELEPAAADTAAPRAVGTDLDGLLREAAARWSGRPLRAVALLSDGHSTAAPPAGTARAAARAVGAFPVLAVGVGDPVGPPDRLIQDLRYPDVAYQGDRVVIEATVGVRGAAGDRDPLVVRLRDEGGRVVAETTRPPGASDGVFELELSVRPAAPGLQVYELEVAPLANERFLANNRATLAVDVRRDRAPLLGVAGRPGWDSRFLAQAAAAETRLRWSLVYRGRNGLVLADSQRQWQSPRQAAGWRRWDGVVLMGWNDVRSDVDWSSLAEAVEGGLGLLVLADDLPAAGAASAAAAGIAASAAGAAGAGAAAAPPPAPLEALLPVDLSRAFWREGAWTIWPDPEGASHPLLAGVTQGVPAGYGLDNGRYPPLSRLLAGPPRPAAVTLLRAAAPQRAGVAGREEAPPVLVTSQQGRGRVTWCGAQQLWELAFWETPQAPPADGEHPGRRLLRNLLIWTASGGEESGLRLVGQRQVYQEGEQVRLETQWTDLRGMPVEGQPVVVELRPADRPGEDPRSFPGEPSSEQPGRTDTVLPPLPPGRYSVRPVSPATPRVEGPPASFVVTPLRLEAAQTRQDRQAMRSLASRWGGTYVPGDAIDAPARVAETLARLPWAGDRLDTQRHGEPWRGWPLLILATVLLGAEWALRRSLGML